MAPARREPPPTILIRDVEPQVDCGRYPVKRVVGEDVVVSATIFRDGHDVLGAAVRYRPPGARRWRESALEPLGNDRWRGSFTVDVPGRWTFSVIAWTDRIASWQREVTRKLEGGQTDLAGELSEGRALLGEDVTLEEAIAVESNDRHGEVELDVKLAVDVDVELARFGAWYELFPRSWGGFAGVEKVLPQLAELGFDVVYLPPIHPIGHTNRKGRNNAVTAKRGDVGSPWAIGAEEGGHTAIHPDLGTLADFERLVTRARETGIEIALDFAIQCSPDHPWLKEHPEWFHRRPDGTLKYAENPPKKYQDIYNVNFASEDWRGLWDALRDAMLHWVEHGVRVFRVDNPHTKPVAFWEWLIAEVRRVEPKLVLLSEAFTRPAMMTTLAKVGFAQSYTYFTWKNTKAELEELMAQILDWREFYRPNFFANTPDILHEYLQLGGRPAFEARLVLAATLSPTYGIYSGFERLRERARAGGLGGVPRFGEVRGQEAEARWPATAARAAAERDPARRARAAAGRQPALARHGAGSTRRVHQGRPRRRGRTSTPSKRTKAWRSCRQHSACRRPSSRAICSAASATAGRSAAISYASTRASRTSSSWRRMCDLLAMSEGQSLGRERNGHVPGTVPGTCAKGTRV